MCVCVGGSCASYTDMFISLQAVTTFLQAFNSYNFRLTMKRGRGCNLKSKVNTVAYKYLNI